MGAPLCRADGIRTCYIHLRKWCSVHMSYGSYGVPPDHHCSGSAQHDQLGRTVMTIPGLNCADKRAVGEPAHCPRLPRLTLAHRLFWLVAGRTAPSARRFAIVIAVSTSASHCYRHGDHLLAKYVPVVGYRRWPGDLPCSCPL